jgi:hypothetical protein
MLDVSIEEKAERKRKKENRNKILPIQHSKLLERSPFLEGARGMF